MKKLTAGIFASLLSVVGISAANANIASQAYVDEKDGAITTRVEAAEGSITTINNNITEIKTVTDAIDTTISDAIDTALDAENEDGVVAKAIAAAVKPVSDKANANETAISEEVTRAKAAEKANADAIGAINNETTGILAQAKADATSKANAAQSAAEAKVTELANGAVKTNTDNITKLNANAETEGSVDYKIAQSKATIDTAVNAAKDAADAAQETANANKAAIENETTGLAATKAIADKNKTDIAAINAEGTGILDTAKGYTDTKVGEVNIKLNDYATTEYVNTEVGKKVATDTYNTQIGTVTSANMGASETATTVVAGIKEANDATKTNAQKIEANKTAIDESLSELGTDVESRLPRPTDACADAKNKCVLVSAGKGNYTWEVIERGTTETTGTAE